MKTDLVLDYYWLIVVLTHSLCIVVMYYYVIFFVVYILVCYKNNMQMIFLCRSSIRSKSGLVINAFQDSIM